MSHGEWRGWSKIILPPTRKKYTKVFSALSAFQFWEMALVFTYYLGKFAPYMYPGLKGKQIKHKKLNLPTFLLF